jgi:GxxExxY protein
MKNENELSKIIVDCAFKVYKRLGPGLLENTYEVCLCHEMSKQGLKVERQKGLPLNYDEIKLEVGYRLDILVEEKVIVEVKSIAAFDDVHYAQVLTYLKLTQCKLG